MPFAPITVNTKTFNSAGDGRYSLSTVTFGNPGNFFTIKGASINRDKMNYTAAISRVLEKDVTVNSIVSRMSASVQLIITVPKQGFTSTDIDSLVSDIDSFVTSGVIDRILAGES
jgi:hypothetical protein